MKGTYLKHISVSILLNKSLTINDTKKNIIKLIGIIGMNMTFMKIVHLFPSFEILCGLKESHLVFSYWKELNLVILDIFSCKNFKIDEVEDFIKKNFPVKNLKCRVIKNYSIKQEVKLCQGI